MGQLLKLMKIKSYSKINLTLRVLNKLKNGIHNIETNSTLINVFDEIIIKKDKKIKLYLKENLKKINSKKIL